MEAKDDTRQSFERVWKLLLEAARVANEEKMDVETFTSAGFQAYVKNSPEIIEAIEDSRISQAVEELRREGRLALA